MTDMSAEIQAQAGHPEAGLGDYFKLLKPRVMSLVIFTALVGMLVAPVPVHPVIGFAAILFIAIGAGAWALLYYWGGIGLFAENAFIGMTEDLIDILFIGYITYHAARIWIDQNIEEEGVDESDSGPLDGEGGGAGATHSGAAATPRRSDHVQVKVTGR